MQQADRFPNLIEVIAASAGRLISVRNIVSRLPLTFQGVEIVATHRDRSTKQNYSFDIHVCDAG